VAHTLVNTAANVSDITLVHALLRGDESAAFGDAGYQGVEKRQENRSRSVKWHVALRPGKRRVLPDTETERLREQLEKFKAGVRTRVENPFHVVRNILDTRGRAVADWPSTRRNCIRSLALRI